MSFYNIYLYLFDKFTKQIYEPFFTKVNIVSGSATGNGIIS